MNPEAGRMWQFAKWAGGTCLGPIWQGAGEHLGVTQDLADTWQKQCPRVDLGPQTGRGGCCKGPCPPGTVAAPTRCPGGSSTNNALTTAVCYFHLFPLHFNKMEKKPQISFFFLPAYWVLWFSSPLLLGWSPFLSHWPSLLSYTARAGMGSILGTWGPVALPNSYVAEVLPNAMCVYSKGLVFFSFSLFKVVMQSCYACTCMWMHLETSTPAFHENNPKAVYSWCSVFAALNW